MSLPVKHSIQHNNFWLSPNRCVFWEEEKLLILSDLHLGKSGHFRKSGIAIPQSVYQQDLQRLITEIQYFQPQYIIVVGDMFHSHANKELDLFLRWRQSIHIPFLLVKGNHDILPQQWYASANIQIHEACYIHNNIGFTHDATCIPQLNDHTNYVFTGHTHPAITLRGLGKQALTLPCFYFCKSYAILPAFSAFTGSMIIETCKEDHIYAILPPDKLHNPQPAILQIS